MRIFSKENGMLRKDNIPFNKPNLFFDMSKITKINPVSKRDGVKLATYTLSND